MSFRRNLNYTPASLAGLRWLTAGGKDVPPQIGQAMLGELFVGPRAVLMGVINGMAINLIALYLAGGAEFGVLMVLDVVLAAVRLVVVRRAWQAATWRADPD